MKILTKLMLTTAVLATAGFAETVEEQTNTTLSELTKQL